MEGLEVTKEKTCIDFDALMDFFKKDSYWAQSRTLAQAKTSVENSLCYTALQAGRFAGFSRVVTDYSTFAYLCDVFVLPEFRRRGIGDALMKAVCADEALKGMRIYLFTKDAHGFYAKYGFGCEENFKNKLMYKT